MASGFTIAVTGPERGGLMAWLMTAWAVRRSGGRAVRVTPSRPCDTRQVHGLIIGGGTDVDPFHYGQAETQVGAGEAADEPGTLADWIVGLLLGFFRILFSARRNQDYDPDRDTMERNLIQYALYENLPVLGICRGAQLMNVALGGSLHQSIEHFYSEETSNVRSILPRKRIALVRDSTLRTTLRRDSCVVNALHNQSVDQLGEGVTISATESSGVIQAIECAAHCFFVGVQWHPEYMPQSRTQQRLFAALGQHAAGVQQHRALR